MLATVKGDVHDIGKNIVGVVLQCNNYEVVDLGVMVPAEKILEAATAQRADIVGLSGLITPSLDEMCHVAAEFQRNGFDIPLLIGGATTSRVHTAVKIHPNYQRGQAVHVNDASRAVGVAGALMSRARRPQYVADVKAEYARVAAAHGRAERDKRRLPLRAARDNALRLDWSSYVPPRPSFLGVRSFADRPLADLIEFIDWTPFFSTWELTGKYPAILEDKKFGEAARALYGDAQKMLARIVEERWFRAAAAVGFWPANQVGDDINVYADEITHHTDRGVAHVAPATGAQGWAPERRAGRFCCEAGSARLHRRFPGDGRDRRGCGRGSVQRRQRRLFVDPRQGPGRSAGGGFCGTPALGGPPELWGYAEDEALTTAEVIAEGYRGIRPAPGYPAQPDHTEKDTLFGLLARPMEAGVQLTESFAMWPGASVCGLYFSHPEARTSGSARSSATKSRTTRNAKAGLSPRPSAGSRRCSTTCRSQPRRARRRSKTIL